MSQQYSEEELQAILKKPRLNLDEARILLTDDNIKSLEVLSFFFYQIGQYDSAKRGVKAILALDEHNSFALNMQVLCADALEQFDAVVQFTANLLPDQVINLNQADKQVSANQSSELDGDTAVDGVHSADANNDGKSGEAAKEESAKDAEAAKAADANEAMKVKALDVDKDSAPMLYQSLLLLRARALQKLQFSSEAQTCIQTLQSFMQEQKNKQPSEP